jgi:hypothetical protein
MTTNPSSMAPIAFRTLKSLTTTQVQRDADRHARDPLHGDSPSGSGFIALLEAFRPTGGTAPGDIVGRLLEEHHVGISVSLAKLIYTGQVFGFEWRASLWIPMFQFDANDLTLKTEPQRVRAELPPLWSGWMQASWFASPNAWLDGRSPVDLLVSDIDAVMRASQSLTEAEEFPCSMARRAYEVSASV